MAYGDRVCWHPSCPRSVDGSDLIHALHINEVDVLILNDAPPLFGRRIVWDGIRVYTGDPELDRDYVVDVQLRAADLEPWLKRMRRRKLELLLP